MNVRLQGVALLRFELFAMAALGRLFTKAQILPLPPT